MKSPTVNSYFVNNNEESRKKAFNERTTKMIMVLLQNRRDAGRYVKNKSEA